MMNAKTGDDTSKNNSYIFDPESSQELARLINQDRFVTRAMGGPLAGLPPLPEESQVLDLGCGPGGWVLDVAFQQPQFEVAGIDCSQRMVAYANARAISQMLSNASFGVMGITSLPLDFADASFDLVNARFLFGVLKRENWPPFIAECIRLLRPGGILRLTEADTMGEALSPALMHLNRLAMQMFWKSGYGFSADGYSLGMTPGLLLLLKQAGYVERHLSSYVIDYSADSSSWADCYRNLESIFLQMKPLFIQHDLVSPEEVDTLYNVALSEMCNAEKFAATGYATSIWIEKTNK